MLDIEPSVQFSLRCLYSNDYAFYSLPYIYHCKTETAMTIKSPDNATITEVTGTHYYNKNGGLVQGFIIWNAGKNVQYFPRGLEKFFDNLKLIYVEHGGIKEIHQTDLKPFPELVSLSFEHNEIENIEDGLFEFNTKLKYIWFSYNKIMTVGSKVFDDLPNLVSLFFNVNPCIDMESDNNAEKVKEIVEYATENCDDPKYVELRKKILSLETDLKKANFEASKAVLDKFHEFEKKLDDSRVEHFEALRNKLESLHDKTDNMADKHNYWLIFFLGSFGFLFVVVVAVGAVVIFRRNGGQVPYFS
jgi:Leucine-rich repeat (LRR) protein